eukprot:scaffold98350_cov20-Tisochrysis_lutea.AAC.1
MPDSRYRSPRSGRMATITAPCICIKTAACRAGKHGNNAPPAGSWKGHQLLPKHMYSKQRMPSCKALLLDQQSGMKNKHNN